MWPNTYWIRRIAAVGLLWLSMISAAVHAELRIEEEPARAHTGALAQLVREALSERSPSLAGLDARITIGAAAFQKALAIDDGRPLIAAYITSIEFETTLASRAKSAHITAVFSNPDPRDQVTLAQTLLGNAALGAFDATKESEQRMAADGST